MANDIKITLDVTKLRALDKALPGRADKVVREIAFAVEGEARDGMSPTSPSPAGSPPGVVTGTLKNSIQAQPVKTMQWRVNVSAEYGAAQEFGYEVNNLPARPFLRPAVWRVSRRIKQYFKGLLK